MTFFPRAMWYLASLFFVLFLRILFLIHKLDLTQRWHNRRLWQKQVWIPKRCSTLWDIPISVSQWIPIHISDWMMHGMRWCVCRSWKMQEKNWRKPQNRMYKPRRICSEPCNYLENKKCHNVKALPSAGICTEGSAFAKRDYLPIYWS